MAYAMTKQGSLDNCVTYEFICDAVEDMNAIEDRYRTIGSIAIVLQGASGLEVYISGSDKQWNSLSSIGGGTTGGDTAGLAIHICAQDEVSNGLPDIELPDETTIYLVPTSDASSGNLYDEYIYVDDEWEKFGSASIDLSEYYQKPVSGIPAADLASGVIPDVSGFAPAENPVFTGSISLGRKDNTTVGTNSLAIGNNSEASGETSIALGTGTKAIGTNQIVLGRWNQTKDAGPLIIGAGQSNFIRANHFYLDNLGTGHYYGDLYVNCQANSTGGSKVATESFVTTRVPAPPAADGNYILKVNVSSGTATYSWVALSDLSGVTF